MTAQEIQKPPLPTGEVTLLFTDIAGSSRLWEQHGDRFIPVWQAHDAVLRDAFARFNGYEVKTEGDAFMVAFADPTDAVHCALFAQAALARYPWPPDVAAPRVRIGLHTGEPFVHGNDYFGPVVNRAAHICAAGHGGQTLISGETYQKVRAKVDEKVELTDLGELHLKDMGTPQQLYQAHHPSVEARQFPPPRTLDGQPNNLPIQRTSFVGRAKEIEHVAAYLAQGKKPVLTLTGPGGIGKTRLSLQAAAARAEWFPDGVWYIKLVEAKDVEGAAREIAALMNIPVKGNASYILQVREWLADRRCLLILDDANTIPQADRLIRDLVSGTTNLRCLATARESLQIDEAEDLALSGLSTVSEMSPMTVMDDTTAIAEQNPAHTTNETPNLLTETDAGRLFMERYATLNARMKLTPSEQAAAEKLVVELDGVPVSVERAAQMMDRVPPSVVLEWLNLRLAPERVPPKSEGSSEKKTFRDIMRNAQQVYYTVQEKAKPAMASLGQLLQDVANVATDRKDALQAEELGRETLRLSQENGDDLGVAAALRQLAKVKWQRGDRQSAVAILAVAAETYRRLYSPELPDVQRELDNARDQLLNADGYLPTTPTIEGAILLATQGT